MKNGKEPQKEAVMVIVPAETPTPQAQPQPQAQPTAQDTRLKELEAENSQLRAKLAQSPENFEERVKYYQRKQELIKRLASLDNSHQTIEEHINEVSKEAAEDLFVSDSYKLTVTVKNGYSSEREVLNFRNPVIISDLLSFVLDKVGRKRQQVQTEIEQ